MLEAGAVGPCNMPLNSFDAGADSHACIMFDEGHPCMRRADPLRTCSLLAAADDVL